MTKNGQTFIRSIFRRRGKRTPVCAELATRREADSDRSDIRMFEVGLSAKQSGDHEQGTGDCPRTTLSEQYLPELGTGNAAQEAERNRLIAIAKDNGLFVEKSEWDNLGDRKRLPSGESIVYLSPDGQEVIKLRNPFAKSAIKQMHATDAIYEHLIHNILFPNTRYRFMGISEDLGGVRIVLSQRYISDVFTIPTQDEIDRYLVEGLGLEKEGNYFYGNDMIAVTDVFADGDNVLADGERLYFIDPIIKFKKPATEVLEQYYKLLK